MIAFSNPSCATAAAVLLSLAQDESSSMAEDQRFVILHALADLSEKGESIHVPGWMWNSELSDWDISITRRPAGGLNLHYEAKRSYLRGNPLASGDVALKTRPDSDDLVLACIKIDCVLTSTRWFSDFIPGLRQQLKDEGLL